MAEFDEMRLVFKVPDGYMWRCPCGLGAKAVVSTAGKARIGARDHINRRHPKTPSGPAPVARPPHASGMEADDAEAVLDAARRHGVAIELLSVRDFLERGDGVPGRFETASEVRIATHYPLVDHIALLRTETQLPPRALLAVLDAFERRGYVVLFDVPDWDQPGPKAVIMGATLVPDVACGAYIAGDRRAGTPARACPNTAERLTAVPGPGGRLLRVPLCKLHHRSQEGIDLGQEGGDTFVMFAGSSRPSPGPVRPAPPRPFTLPQKVQETPVQAIEPVPPAPPPDGPGARAVPEPAGRDLPPEPADRPPSPPVVPDKP